MITREFCKINVLWRKAYVPELFFIGCANKIENNGNRSQRTKVIPHLKF